MTQRTLLASLSVWVLLLGLGVARADRPTAPHLLPERTLVYFRVPDTREFVRLMKESALGQILDDEQVRPLASQIYGSTAELFSRVQDRVGLSLEELLKLPQGEICVALLRMKEGPPALVALLEVGDQLPQAQKLLDRFYAELEKNGATASREMAGDTQLVVHTVPADANRTVVQFVRDGVIGVATTVEAAKQTLAFWRGENDKEQKTLADNRDFTAIMSRCSGTKDDRPQVTWYINPIDLVRTAARGNTGAQAGLALLPALGLDGVKGLGGSLLMGSGEFDNIQHFHLLLENPRSGVVKMLALGSGDTTPENWVPNDVQTYTTGYIDLPTTRQELMRLVDAIQGEGRFARFTKERIGDPLGVDFEKELFGVAQGRFTYITRFERPIRLNSNTQLLAVKLNDADTFRGTVDKIISKFADRFEKKSFGGVSYYRMEGQPPRPPQRAGEPAGNANPPRVRLEFRTPELCVAVVGDYVILSDSAGLLQQCVISQSDESKRLAAELDFKLMSTKIRRQAGGSKLSLLTFNRPEEGMRMLYDLASAENTRKVLSERSGNNEFFRLLNTTLNDKPLPPFAVFSKYLAPGGGMVVDDETGVHYSAYAMRRKK